MSIFDGFVSHSVPVAWLALGLLLVLALAWATGGRNKKG